MRIRFFVVMAISTAATLCGAACGGTPAGQLAASVASSSSSSAGGRANSGSAASSASTGSGGAGGGALASPPPPGPAHAPDGTGTTVFAVSKHQKATRGIISGVIPTSPLIQQLQIELSPLPTLCGYDGGPYGLAQIAEASDILQDGTQDPTQTCDGISIGLGFDALPVQLGPTVQPLPQPFPCDIDAGDVGSDGG